MNYPNELIKLPSQGYWYSSDHPLSNGVIELRLFNAFHEELLCNPNLRKNSIWLDWLLKDIIVDKTIDINSILKCDCNGILVAERILSMGSKYSVKMTCPSCAESFDWDVDLTKLNNADLDFSKYEKGQSTISFELPNSNHKIVFIPETVGMMKNINEGSSVDLYKQIIISIDGNETKSFIYDFIENQMTAKNSVAFKKFIKSNTPQMNLCFDTTCPHCNEINKIDQPITVDFFGIDASYKVGLFEELFSLSFYSEGGFPVEQVYCLPTSARKFYLRKLLEAKEAEKKASEGKSPNTSSPIQRPNIQRKGMSDTPMKPFPTTSRK